VTIIEAVTDPALFGRWFRGDSWSAWRVFLAALFGLPTDPEIFQRHTKRTVMPSEASREAWLVVGRRGGKSMVAALVATFLACFRDYRSFLGPGEVATVMVVAADRRQARTILRYISGFLEGCPMLAPMVVRRRAESIELRNRVMIEVHTCSFRAVRGYTIAAAICDEVAFWRSDESANPDTEVLSAVRPALATIPGSLLLCISSPYARRGALWDAYQKHFGKDDDPILVWQAATRAMNFSVPEHVVMQAYQDDESAASAEYGAQFRRDIETFVAREAVEACRVPGRLELAPVESVQYMGFVDPSGGSSDSMTLAIAHAEGEKAVLDLVRERRPPFSPEAVTKEFADDLKSYGIHEGRSDRYGGQWITEAFEKVGITIRPAEKSKSDIYHDLLPRLNSGRVELLDNPRLFTQLCNLERRTARGGRDSIDHAPGSHDDLVNAAAGALGMASEPGSSWGFIDISSDTQGDEPQLHTILESGFWPIG
jgi:hypothetical protein